MQLTKADIRGRVEVGGACRDQSRSSVSVLYSLAERANPWMDRWTESSGSDGHQKGKKNPHTSMEKQRKRAGGQESAAVKPQRLPRPSDIDQRVPLQELEWFLPT